MVQFTKGTSKQSIQEARERRLAAMHLQDLAGNPLDAAEIAVFEMFECENWTDEKRRVFIIECACGSAGCGQLVSDCP